MARRPLLARLRLRILAGLALAGVAVAVPSGAQQSQPAPPPAPQPLPASLVADQVTYDRDSQVLTATGNVEVLYQGRVLRASRVVYDQKADRIDVEGPLLLTDPAGRVLIADSATLTPDLEDGLISSARLLIAGQLQLAAVEVRRTGGRYATLQRTIASSCTICAENPTPTWAIRASRVTEDAGLRRIYFENARIEMFGLPVGFIPRLSIPEPGVDRASGLLAPSFQQSDIYGFGFKLPYYRVLGPSADTTITPFLTTEGGLLMEGEYRRRFSNGGFDLWGVISLTDGLNQDLGGGAGRGAFSAVGRFELPERLHPRLRPEPRHRLDLPQPVRLYRHRPAHQRRPRAQDPRQRLFRDRHRRLPEPGRRRGQQGRPLRLPRVHLPPADRDPRSRRPPRPRASTRSASCATPAATCSAPAARWTGRATGRCRTASSPRASPRRWSTSTRSGRIPTSPTASRSRPRPTAAFELRWPLVRHAERADHVIEPIVQVVYSSALRDQHDIPNEDSRLPEFDETNLFSLNRFPGLDRLETGLRANLGISYTRYDPAGWSLGMTLGQVLRSESQEDFAEGTGLAGRSSDYVGAVSLDFGWGLQLINRALFDPGLNFRRNEFALAYDGDRGSLRAAYVYLAADASNPILGPQPETNEIALDARVRVHRNWELQGLWRYDVATNSNLRAAAGITYGNECAEFDLSVSRRYTSSDNLPPSTSIGFNLRLAGIGTNGQNDWPREGLHRTRDLSGAEGMTMRNLIRALAICLLPLAPARARREPLRAGAHRQRQRDHPLRHRAADQAARRARRQRRPAQARGPAAHRGPRQGRRPPRELEIELPEGAIDAGIEEFATGRGLTDRGRLPGARRPAASTARRWTTSSNPG